MKMLLSVLMLSLFAATASMADDHGEAAVEKKETTQVEKKAVSKKGKKAAPAAVKKKAAVEKEMHSEEAHSDDHQNH